MPWKPWSGKQTALFYAPFLMGGVLLSGEIGLTAKGVKIFLTSIFKKFIIMVEGNRYVRMNNKCGIFLIVYLELQKYL